MTDAATTPRWIEYVRLADVVPADRNPKDHDEQLLDGSVRRFGFVEPVNRDERTGKLIAGHGRLEALARAERAGPPEDYTGEWPPDGIEVDADDGAWLLPIVRGWASANDQEAEAYVIVANRSSERGGWRAVDLATQLAEMERAAQDLMAIGFSEDEYREILSSSGVLSDMESAWLDPLAEGASAKPPEKDSVRSLQRATDIVDLRLPMSPAERDEAVALLRAAQRAAGAATLAGTLLTVLRAHSGQ